MFKGKITSFFAAIAGLLLFAGSAQANLLNGSFEAPDASGGDVGCSQDWSCFNSTFTASNNFMPGGSFASPGALDGTQVLKQFGFDAGATQRVAVSPGNPVNASVSAINWSGDPFNNLGIFQLAFFDSGGDQVGGVSEVVCDSLGNQACQLTPQDGAEPTDWTELALNGVIAPAGAAEVQVLLLHVLTDGTPSAGALFWDNASVQVIPVPAAVWLFGSALGLLAAVRRRFKS